MALIECPECSEPISDDLDECPNCESPVEPGRVESVAESALELPEAIIAPSGSWKTRLTVAKVSAVMMMAWLGVQAWTSWLAYDEGYIGALVPVWNAVFWVGTLPIAVGIFKRSLWAQRWAVGICTFTAIGNALHALRSGATLLWVGVLVLAAAAIGMSVAKQGFKHKRDGSSIIQQAVATLVVAGSLVIGVMSLGSTGTDRGRKAFVAEIQTAYDKAGAPVRVYANGLQLVIEAPSDTDESIDAAADAMQATLAEHGGRAKAWVVGFESMVITNGKRQRLLRP